MNHGVMFCSDFVNIEFDIEAVDGNGDTALHQRFEAHVYCFIGAFAK